MQTPSAQIAAQTARTPGPWTRTTHRTGGAKINRQYFQRVHDGDRVVIDRIAPQDADVLFRKLSAHDDLVAALRKIRCEPMSEASTHGPRFRCASCNHAWTMGGESHHAHNCASEIARVALAKAGAL